MLLCCVVGMKVGLVLRGKLEVFFVANGFLSQSPRRLAKRFASMLALTCALFSFVSYRGNLGQSGLDGNMTEYDYLPGANDWTLFDRPAWWCLAGRLECIWRHTWLQNMSGLRRRRY